MNCKKCKWYNGSMRTKCERNEKDKQDIGEIDMKHMNKELLLQEYRLLENDLNEIKKEMDRISENMKLFRERIEKDLVAE